MRWVIVVMMGWMLTACTDLGLAAANRLAYLSGQKRISDVEYGSKARQKLDIYVPKNKPDNAPVIIFFYGGAWKDGSKDLYPFVAEAFTSRGYVVVIPDYAKYPEFRFPVFAEDAALSLAWTQKNIAQYGGDAKKLFVAGHSAGAHIGALVLADRRYIKAAGGTRAGILGFAGLAGPYDFVPTEPDYIAIFRDAGKNAKQGMPATFVDGTQPPMLLLQGLADDVVGMVNIEGMQRQVKKHGGKLVVKTYPDAGHIDIIAALAKPLRGDELVFNDVITFFDEQLRDR